MEGLQRLIEFRDCQLSAIHRLRAVALARGDERCERVKVVGIGRMLPLDAPH
jgi:hypothetical protein